MILDAIISFLLLATIGYSWKLSRKITAIHEGRKELEQFIQNFNQAISRAEVSIATLRTLSNETDGSLKTHIEKARFLTNDLAFLTYRGNVVANRLEQHINGAHAIDPDPMGLKATKSSATTVTTVYDDQTQAFVHKPALKPMDRTLANKAKMSGTPQDMSPSKKQALEQALAVIAKRHKRTPTPAPEVTAKAKDTAEQTRSAKGNISGVRQSLDSLRTSLELKT